MLSALPGTRAPSLYLMVFVRAAPGFRGAAGAPAFEDVTTGPGLGCAFTIRPFSSIVFGISNVCLISFGAVGVILRVISHFSAIVFREMGLMSRTIGVEL